MLDLMEVKDIKLSKEVINKEENLVFTISFTKSYINNKPGGDINYSVLVDVLKSGGSFDSGSYSILSAGAFTNELKFSLKRRKYGSQGGARGTIADGSFIKVSCNTRFELPGGGYGTAWRYAYAEGILAPPRSITATKTAGGALVNLAPPPFKDGELPSASGQRYNLYRVVSGLSGLTTKKIVSNELLFPSVSFTDSFVPEEVDQRVAYLGEFLSQTLQPDSEEGLASSQTLSNEIKAAAPPYKPTAAFSYPGSVMDKRYFADKQVATGLPLEQATLAWQFNSADGSAQTSARVGDTVIAGQATSYSYFIENYKPNGATSTVEVSTSGLSGEYGPPATVEFSVQDPSPVSLTISGATELEGGGLQWTPGALATATLQRIVSSATPAFQVRYQVGVDVVNGGGEVVATIETDSADTVTMPLGPLDGTLVDGETYTIRAKAKGIGVMYFDTTDEKQLLFDVPSPDAPTIETVELPGKRLGVTIVTDDYTDLAAVFLNDSSVSATGWVEYRQGVPIDVGPVPLDSKLKVVAKVKSSDNGGISPSSLASTVSISSNASLFIDDTSSNEQWSLKRNAALDRSVERTSESYTFLGAKSPAVFFGQDATETITISGAVSYPSTQGKWMGLAFAGPKLTLRGPGGLFETVSLDGEVGYSKGAGLGAADASVSLKVVE